MITARLRHRLQSGFVAHVRRHSKWYPISPNVLTFGALVLAIPACWAIAERHYLLAVSFILASGAIDFIDGCVARGLERTTKFGSYWDAMIDRYVDCLLYLGFVLDGYELEAFLATTGTVLTSYAKPRTAMVVAIYAQDWPTIGERAERFVLLLAGLLLAHWLPTVGGWQTIGLMLWATALMTHIGAIQRVLMTRRLVSDEDHERESHCHDDE
ncbi:MAG TPA: CDP-alcohol phosphatidyltransferase family protein [Candidatus Handelsmanbacteria bacterium]|nr:CDP-alcohol phosphatidyltransferase family protein [Candidatus Handelsmanbacteria bacterium]